MKKFLSLFLFCISGLAMRAQAIEADGTKPNIIFIVVDDLNDWAAGYNGQPQSVTPGLKKIEKLGTTFVNTECTSPVCGPSRTSLLSGKNPYYTQDYTNSKCVSFRSKFTAAKGNETVFTLPEYLKDSVGYYTYNIGKVYDCHSNNASFYDYDDITSDFCAKSLSWSEYYSPDGNESHIVRNYADTLNAGIGDFSTCALPNDMEDDMYDYMNTTKAVDFINGVSAGTKDLCDKPFALFFGIRKPHTPWYVPEKYFLPYYDADYETDDYAFNFNTNPLAPYNGVVMPPQPAVRWQDYYDLPEGGLARWIADISNCEDSIINKINLLAAEGAFGAMSTDTTYLQNMQESLRGNMIMAYIAGIKFMDAQVNRVFTALKSHPDMYSNTIIVIISDNAFNHGEKRHWSKAALWEGSERVPFIVADLRNPIKKRVTRQVSLLDIYPTLLDMIEAPAPVFPDGTPYLDGHSLKTLMAHPHMAWTSPALMTFKSLKGSQLSCFPQYAVKDNNFKYIRYQSNNFGSILSCNESMSYFEEELYQIGENRNIDPYEWNNLISDPAYDDEKEYLQQFLPGGSMYLMRAIPVENAETNYPCLFSEDEDLHMQARIYDDNGNIDELPVNCIYKWYYSGSNVQQDIKTSPVFDLSVNRCAEYADLHGGKFHVYLQIVDTVSNAIKGFNMFDFYTRSAAEPEIAFAAEVNNQGVYINDIQYSGPVNLISWNYGDNEIYEGFYPPSHIYAKSGEYTITATALYGNNNCEKIFSRTISIGQRSNTSEFEVFAYPDPASVSAKIFYPAALTEPLISVYNAEGHLVKQYTEPISGETFSLDINVADLPAGMYTIKTQQDSGIYTCQIIVIR